MLVFNNVHFFQHNEEGTNMLLQLQQRAEAWAESGTFVLSLGVGVGVGVCMKLIRRVFFSFPLF